MLADRFRVWKTAYNTANLPVGMTTPPDSISKWLVITRAAVFSMTVTSGLIGGLLAVGAERLAQVGGGPIGGPFTRRLRAAASSRSSASSSRTPRTT